MRTTFICTTRGLLGSVFRSALRLFAEQVGDGFGCSLSAGGETGPVVEINQHAATVGGDDGIAAIDFQI